MVSLDRVAELVDQPRALLVRLARRGEFPPVVRFTTRAHSVDLQEVIGWLAKHRIDGARAALERDWIKAQLPPRRRGRRAV